MMNTQEINCLRCRQCQLTPQTDFSQPATVIFCGKLGYRQTANLSGCGLAVPTLRYRGSSRGAVKLNGDKTRNASPVEIAYLRVNLASADWSTLQRHTGRTRETLLTMSRTHGIGEPGQRRAPSVKAKVMRKFAKAAKSGRQAKGQIINAAQSAYIMARYESGDWPRRGGWNHPKYLVERYALQAEIVEAVAALGPRWSWETIVKHPRYLAPGYHRWDAKRRAVKKSRRLSQQQAVTL